MGRDLHQPKGNWGVKLNSMVNNVWLVVENLTPCYLSPIGPCQDVRTYSP
jgi:hypothetical protein